IRILEYSGVDTVDPMDVNTAATGDSATRNSGRANTKNAVDLLVGANTVSTPTTGPGRGFTQRVVSDGAIAEDGVVTGVGSYGASATLSSAGPWVMQMLSFRVA